MALLPPLHVYEHIHERVLPAFPGLRNATVGPLGNGLINQTFLVEQHAERFVLQRLAPIFPASINENIAVVTARLASAGLTTPLLLQTFDGRPCLDLGPEGGVWRLQTYVPGTSFDKVQSPQQAKAAGELIGRFHGALDGLGHGFVGLRLGVHDTDSHLANLRGALARHPQHRLYEQARALAEAILARAQEMTPLPELPPRICHGDLKLNNVLFAGERSPSSEIAVCLIDLDTVGPMSLAFELGDAWRSWCNRSGEDSPQAHVDLEVMRASLEGYGEGIGHPLSAIERRALLGAVEWISLELAARFLSDALDESYFGWNSRWYPTRGEHNLVRARGQFALHEAFLKTRQERAEILVVAA